MNCQELQGQGNGKSLWLINHSLKNFQRARISRKGLPLSRSVPERRKRGSRADSPGPCPNGGGDTPVLVEPSIKGKVMSGQGHWGYLWFKDPVSYTTCRAQGPSYFIVLTTERWPAMLYNI